MDSEHLCSHEQSEGLLFTKGGNSLGDVPSWQKMLMMPPLSEAVVGVVSNQETRSPAMIFNLDGRDCLVSTDIPYGINDLGTGTILQCIYSIQSSEWVPKVVFRDWLSIGLAIGLTVLNAGLNNKYEYGG